MLRSVPERSQSARSGPAAAPDASSKPADFQGFGIIPIRFCPDPGLVLQGCGCPPSNEAVSSIKSALLARRPQRASANKWNKLLPSFDFFTFAMACSGLLSKMVHMAMQPLAVKFNKVKDFAGG